MAENGVIESVDSGDILGELPNMKGDGYDEKEEESVKPTLNRSSSCGSILQGNGMNKIKNLSRRVSFPSDDKLISGYNEPKNPWEHAHETTTEDLIQAYTQACQQWNVRPITKLLLQLQEITDFTVRANSLTLKGEKLEMRVVETLESIFKRVQFITIDLEATNLDEDAGASLFDMIEYYESAVNVLVGFNKNLGNRGWQAAAHMMRKMSCLRLFDGHSVPLSIQASPFVGRALRLSNTLVTLHLENAMLSGRPLLLIVAALRMNTTLRELFLADNRFSPLDALQLANLLKFNRILQLLDIRNNPVQDMGLGHLCAGLMAQSGTSGLNGPTGGLNTLVLWNNQISHEGMAKLAMALRYTVSLSTLNLGQNVLGDDGILRLKEGLLQNHSLLRLGLVGTKLTDEGAVAVAEYLAESPRIIRLDLRNNDIRVAGLMALSLAFKINNSLLRLDIDKPNKKDALKELAAKQENLMNDMVSYAARNKQTALEKAQALRQRQEEVRRADAASEESGLRYMDMTNASTSPTMSTTVTETSSSNNSNNQTPALRREGQEFEGVNVETSNPTLATVSPDTDDTPEDSPEFLPRSSVSYHQVAPVMLSNSEMAKRAAAAAKLQPVMEHQDETLSVTNQPQNGAISDFNDDVFHGENEAKAPQLCSFENNASVPERRPEQEMQVSKDQDKVPSNDSSSPLNKPILSEMEDSKGATHPPDDAIENPSVQQKVETCKGPEEASANDSVLGPPSAGSSKSPATKGTNAVDAHSSSTSLHANLSTHSSESDHKIATLCSTDDATRQDWRESQTPIAEASTPQSPKDVIRDTVHHETSDFISCSDATSDAKPLFQDNDADDAIRLLVTMATESSAKEEVTPDPVVKSDPNPQAQRDGDAIVGSSVSANTVSRFEEGDLASKFVLAPFPPNACISENANVVVDKDADKKELVAMGSGSDSKLLSFHRPDNEEKNQLPVGFENAVKEESAVVIVNVPDPDDVTTEESSGFENGAEDCSIQSGDLSPMLEDSSGGSKLLTPDSGIIHFEHAGLMGDAESGSTSEKESRTTKTSIVYLGHQQDNHVDSVVSEDYICQQNIGKTADLTLPLSVTSDFGQGDFQSPLNAVNDENGPKPVRNMIPGGAIDHGIDKNSPKVLDSPCEVEVSHFDLSKFPTGE